MSLTLRNILCKYSRYLLGFLFPHTHVRVIPYNRCVTDLGGRSSAEFLRLVSSVFDIKDHNSNSSSSNSGNMSSSSGSGSSDSDSDSSKSTNSSSHRISNTYSEYERRSLGVAALNESSSRLRGRGTVSLTESSLSLLPLLDSQFMLPKCNDYEKMSSKDKMFDCLDTAPCSSTDSDSIDSFDQYDLEGSECSVHVEGPPCPYYTSHNRLDSLERAALKGKRSTVAAASAPVGHKSRAHNTPIAQQQVYCEGIASMSECSDDAQQQQQQQQHLILMYFQGRWLDLVPLDAVEENDSDPLSSLDIQV